MRQRKPITESTSHGTDSTYCNYGCRCEPCTAAHREVGRRARKSFTDGEHGVVGSYDRGCRCRLCVRAKRGQSMYRLYGITSDEYDLLYSKQEGNCGICQRHFESLHIDHDHDTNKVRGLLCKRCNTTLGYLGDNREGVLRALAYLDASN